MSSLLVRGNAGRNRARASIPSILKNAGSCAPVHGFVISSFGTVLSLRVVHRCIIKDTMVTANNTHTIATIVSGTVSKLGAGTPGRRVRETTGRLADIRNQSAQHEIRTSRCLSRKGEEANPIRASMIPAAIEIGRSVDAMKKIVAHRSSPLYNVGPHIGATMKKE